MTKRPNSSDLSSQNNNNHHHHNPFVLVRVDVVQHTNQRVLDVFNRQWVKLDGQTHRILGFSESMKWIGSLENPLFQEIVHPQDRERAKRVLLMGGNEEKQKVYLRMLTKQNSIHSEQTNEWQFCDVHKVVLESEDNSEICLAMEPVDSTFAEEIVSVDEEIVFDLNVDMSVGLSSCSTVNHLALLPKEVCRLHFCELVEQDDLFKCFYWFHKVLREGNWSECLRLKNSLFVFYEMTGILVRKPSGKFGVFAIGVGRTTQPFETDSLAQMRWDLAFNTPNLPLALTQYKYDRVDLRSVRVVPRSFAQKFVRVDPCDEQCIQSVRRITRHAISKETPAKINTLLRNLLEINVVGGSETQQTKRHSSDAELEKLFDHELGEQCQNGEKTKRIKLDYCRAKEDETKRTSDLSSPDETDYFGFDRSL